MAVRFGVFVPQGWRMDLVEIADPVEKYEAMTRVAKLADSLPAYDSIWVYDHFHTVPRPSKETTFEAWTITAGLVRDTQRVNVGQMVTSLGYRNPALMAKMASTVDVMAHGRLYCGVGAGWYEHEWRAYGYGFPETRERMRAFREAVQIMVRMWTEDEPEFAGEYHSIHRPINEPRGVRTPHPSLWIGGSGEQVTLKLVAQYGDACNFAGDPDTLRRKLGILRQHCEKVGRDYDQIIKSSNIFALPLRPGEDAEKATAPTQRTLGVTLAELRQQTLIGTADEIAAEVQTRIDAGMDYINFYVGQVAYEPERVQYLADQVISRFR
jgi:F420-dependent oxidoreductase-like protein